MEFSYNEVSEPYQRTDYSHAIAPMGRVGWRPAIAIGATNDFRMPLAPSPRGRAAWRPAVAIGATHAFSLGAVSVRDDQAAPGTKLVTALQPYDARRGQHKPSIPSPVGWWRMIMQRLERPAVARKNTSKPNKHPVWGRWLVLWIATRWAPLLRRPNLTTTQGDSGHTNTTPYGPTHFPPIRAGGGFQRDVTRRNERLAQHDVDGGSVALDSWWEWYGANATKINKKFTESSIGGSIADATRKL